MNYSREIHAMFMYRQSMLQYGVAQTPVYFFDSSSGILENSCNLFVKNR